MPCPSVCHFPQLPLINQPDDRMPDVEASASAPSPKRASDSATRDRSPPPASAPGRRDARSRSRDRRDRSPPRRDDRGDRPKKKNNFGGFRYKDKRRDDYDARDDRDGDRRPGGSFRGYRDRSRSPRRRFRDDDRGGRGSGDRDRDQGRDRDGGGGYRDRPRDRERDRSPRRGAGDRGRDRDGGRDRRRGDDDGRPPKRAAPAAPIAAGPNDGFIVVWVNDRLGTKEAIPCLPTDTVGEFKILVASRIGRKPHEIKLQRQGERPLKDMITLADYEISNGRQLDLEVGTGD